MKKPDRALTLVFLVTLVLVIQRCSNLGGDVTETGNALVSGRVLDSSGQPISQARVMLLPALYNPMVDPSIPDSMIGITDQTGTYTVKAPGQGNYSVEAWDMASKDKALVTGITIDKNDLFIIRESVLREPGAIRVLLQDTANEATGYVYLPGTTCFARALNGFAMVDAVPAGYIPAVYYTNTAAPAREHVIQTDLTVMSNDTQVIADTTPWRYSKKLFFNTTAAGAGVGIDVHDFPVLVRLNSVNFDFSQAKNDGSDMRFAKPDHAPLDCEIEHWDPVSQTAAIWIRVDTVYGNDASHYIVMYWGNPAAADGSRSAAVFDTANGFQGVWHLSEAGTAMAKDATANHYDGTPSDTAPAGAEGVIGSCRSFNGSSSFIRMNGTAGSRLNFNENGEYTVSAWAFADSIDNSSHLIVGKGNEQYFMKFKFSLPTDPMVWEFVEYHDKKGWSITNSLPVIPTAKTWTHIVGVRKGTVQYFFVNGVLVDSSITVNSSGVSRSAGEEVTIGRFFSVPPDSIEGICPFLGKIDEVRISNVAYGADWIKLCYMNQKEQDALVKW